MKVIDYKIVRGFGTELLEESVLEHILSGWQPIGGVTFSQVEFDLPMNNRDTVWAQAMVKYSLD